MNRILYFFFIIQYIFGKEEEASAANKELASNDESIIVNKDGLNDASDSEKKYQRNPRTPPKNLKKLTLSQVAQQAKEDGLGSVAVLAVYAKDSALHRLPETVLQVAEKDLENNTKTDVQYVDYGADLEGYTEDSKEEEEENTNNDNKENKDNKEGDNASNDEPKTSEGQQNASSKN